MTMEEFCQCSLTDQVCALLEHGRLVSRVSEGNDRIFTYRLHAFFVTTRFQGNDDALCEITCFEGSAHHTPLQQRQPFAIHPAERISHQKGEG